MTDEFTASNGAKVRYGPLGEMEVVPPKDAPLWLPVSKTKAIREFFQAERDAELGRWRWPEDLDYVVYAVDSGWFVLNEQTGATKHYGYRDHAQVGNSLLSQAARAYFEAHPEPKPWEDAKPGEVWELTMKPGVCDRFNPTLFRAVGREFGGIDFYAVEPSYTVTHLGENASVITSGRRIWPEDA